MTTPDVEETLVIPRVPAPMSANPAATMRELHEALNALVDEAADGLPTTDAHNAVIDASEPMYEAISRYDVDGSVPIEVWEESAVEDDNPALADWPEVQLIEVQHRVNMMRDAWNRMMYGYFD